MKFLHTKKKIYNELIDLGLKRGMYVNLKCSYNSLGNIEGGPMSLIDIILDIIKENGLLVTDSFVRMYKVGSRDIINNKVDQNTETYAGLIANTAIKHKNCFRSHHPVQKFSLIGEEANNLAIEHNKNSYAYDILKIISEEKNSFNLKIGPDDKVIGVGTTHVATGILNIEKYEQKVGVYYEVSENKYELFRRNWIGICKNTLLKLNNFYNENTNINKSRGKVGNTHALLTNMRETLDEELKLFRLSKDNISCGKKYCFECYTVKNNYRKHTNFFIKNFINFKIKNIAKFLYYDLSLQPTFKIK